MSALALTNASVVINSSDISAYVRKVTLPIEAEELETTAMSSSGYRTRIAGLKDGTVDLELINDFAAAALDSIIWPLFATVVSWAIKPVNATVTTSNPLFSGNVLISQVNPLDGSVGDLAVRSVTWPNSGLISRATA